MNTSHPVKLRSKTQVRLRSMAEDLETSAAAIIKHAVEGAVAEAWAAGSLVIPVHTRGKSEAKDPFVRSSHPVKLEEETEERLQRMAAQMPLLKVSSIIRGAIERFVDRAHREGQIVIPFRTGPGQPPASATEEPRLARMLE